MKKTWITNALVTVALLVGFLVPRFLTLDAFVTIDEPGWLNRALNFQHAFARGDFAATYLTEHPGVTIMWAGSLGHLWACPGCTGTDGLPHDDYEAYEAYLAAHGAHELDVLRASRAVMVLGNAMAWILAYGLARRLLGAGVATLGFVLIALDPFFTAHTQLLHLDGMMACMMLLALLGFILYLRTERLVVLALSAVAAALSWLTKSPSIFLVPAVGIIAVLDWIRTDRRWAGVWPRLARLCLWGAMAAVVFAALWPAMWVAPADTLRQMASAALDHAEGGHGSPLFFNGQVAQDGRLGFDFYPVSLVWRSTPVVLGGLLAAVVACVLSVFVQRDKARSTTSGRLALLAFIVLCAAQLSLGSKKFDRYLLPIYPPLILLAADGWVRLGAWVGQLWQHRLRRRVGQALVAALVVAHALGLIHSFPYYLSYFNPALGGLSGAVDVLTVGWGEGLDRAAAYLAALPDAETLRVVAWYRPGVSYFFPGETEFIDNQPDVSQERLDHFLSADYMVIYVHQWQRHIPKSLMDYMADRAPEYVAYVDDVPYVFVYALG